MNQRSLWLFEAPMKSERDIYTNSEYDRFLELEWEWDTISKPMKCSEVTTNCPMTKDEEKRIKYKNRTPEGDFIPRTQGDPTANLALQLIDFDVNDWMPRKPKHQEAIQKIIQFIVKRIGESNQDIEVTITGSASRTGTKEHNDILSCRRANCVAENIRLGLWGYGVRRAVKINPSGNGFEMSQCKGVECELKEYRSVLIQVHAPGNPPPPIRVVPGWDKYKIRCCSYKTEQIAEILIGGALDGILPGVPGTVRDTIIKKVEEWVKKTLERIVKKNPSWSRLLKSLSKLLRYFPARIVRDIAVFQIVEREKPSPENSILCYTGYGITILHPREALDPLLDKLGPLPDSVKEALKKTLEEIPGLGTAIKPIDSDTPGPFKTFDLDRKERLQVFEGIAQIGKDALTPGKVHLIFSSPPFKRPDPWKRPKIINCPDCATSVIPIQVGDGRGHEIFGVTEGQLKPGKCICSESSRPSMSRVRYKRRPLPKVAARKQLVRR